MRLSFVGELGWELHVPKPACVPVYRAVMAAGTKHGLVNAGYRAIDSLSIEKGVWGAHRAPPGCPEPRCRWGGGGCRPLCFFPAPLPFPPAPFCRPPQPSPHQPLHCPQTMASTQAWGRGWGP